MSVYHCMNVTCSEWHKEVTGMDPAECRMATGRSFACRVCQNVMRWLRKA
jgi:hypothetical protein